MLGNYLMRIALVIALLTVGFGMLAASIHWVDVNKEHVLVMGAGEKGSDSYVLGTAISEIAKRHDPKLKIVVAETAGSDQNNKMMHEGHLQLAAELADTKIGSHTRLVTILYPDTYQLLVCSDSGIENIADLRGKTIALPDKQSGEYQSFYFLAKHYGLRESDMNAVTMSTNAAAWALESRAVDAIFRVRAPGNDALADIIQNGGINITPINQSRALSLEKPSIREGFIPAGSYSGFPAVPASDLEAPTIDRVLVASDTVSEDIIERLTRLIYDYQREMSDFTPLAGFLADEASLEQSAIPLHNGTRDYFDRDEPSFLQENAELMALYLTLLAGLISLLLNINNRRQKERVDAYNRELIKVYNAAVDDPDPSGAFFRNRMMDIFARILRDFEQGLVTSNGFDFLSFAWDELNDAVIAVVDDKNGKTLARRKGKRS
jgi:TRAP transporter TAXI family solute receptor